MARVHLNLKAENGDCPYCGTAFTPVAYHTGKKDVVQKSDGEDKQQQVVIYRKVKSHTGEICLNCAKKRERPQRIAGFVYQAMGALLLVIALAVLIYGRGLAGLEHPSMFVLPLVCGILSLLIGVVMLRTSFPVKEGMTPDELSTLLIRYAPTGHLKKEEVFITTGELAAADQQKSKYLAESFQG